MVIAAVGDNALGAPTRSSDLPTDRPDAVDERQQLGDVVAVAAGQRDRQRDAGRVDQEMVL